MPRRERGAGQPWLLTVGESPPRAQPWRGTSTKDADTIPCVAYGSTSTLERILGDVFLGIYLPPELLTKML